jgi:outer membrane receptor protein involved in Fe transport
MRAPLAAALMLLAANAVEAADAPSSQPAGSTDTLETIEITATRLDEARNGLSPDTGSSIYRLSHDDLVALHLGEATPFNQVMLQAPGVVGDSFGQLHVRGDHANLQYRINGVVIPEAITGFGQTLDSRFANQLNFLTGALPAQFGYRTAGVIDIQTKGYVPDKSGSVSVAGGSRDQGEAGMEAVGSSGAFSYSLIGSYLRNDLGIENPTPMPDALHDTTTQAKGFGYLSYILDDRSRVSLMFGISDNHFEIPNTPGQIPDFVLAGVPTVDSALLDARQQEQNSFEALSYQAADRNNFNYQVSLFHRLTTVHYTPDPVGDLVFNGITADTTRADQETGLQADGSYRVGKFHTVRMGVFYNEERFSVANSATVFPADAAGNQTSTNPFLILDDSKIDGHTGGVYLQDEWQPVKALTINYGARYDRVNTVVDEQQFSPRLGMVYKLTAATSVHVGYARYFTPPPTEKIDTTSVAKFLNTTNALPSDANTAVSSERSHYYDAGISQKLGSRTTIGLDAYYRTVRNLQDEGQFGNALIFSAFNYAEGRIHGVELTTSYHADHLSAYGNLAYSVAKARTVATGQFNFDDAELAYIATHWVHLDHDQLWAGSAGVSYTWATNTLSADGVFGSGLRRGFANSESLPSYGVLNVAAHRPFGARGLGKLEERVSLLDVTDRVSQLEGRLRHWCRRAPVRTRRADYPSLKRISEAAANACAKKNAAQRRGVSFPAVTPEKSGSNLLRDRL